MKTKYNIGDKLNNTQAIGDCEIVDVYVSPTSGEAVYKVKESGQMEGTYLFTEYDLEEQ